MMKKPILLFSKILFLRCNIQQSHNYTDSFENFAKNYRIDNGFLALPHNNNNNNNKTGEIDPRAGPKNV